MCKKAPSAKGVHGFSQSETRQSTLLAFVQFITTVTVTCRKHEKIKTRGFEDDVLRWEEARTVKNS
jgi:hypothetical protein